MSYWGISWSRSWGKSWGAIARPSAPSAVLVRRRLPAIDIMRLCILATGAQQIMAKPTEKR